MADASPIPDAPTVQMLAAALAIQTSGRLLEAETAYRAILDEQPNLAVALFLYAALIGRRDPPGAVGLLERCLACRPGHVGTEVALASASLRAGNAARAITLYRAALTGDPTHVGAWINLSVALRKTGEADAALAAAREAVARAPLLADAHAAHAACLLLCGDPTSAVEVADHALALSPKLAEALFVRGTGLSALGRADQAVAALREAVRIAPDHARARLNLGNALADQDRLAEAETECRAALAADPGLIEAHASLAFLLTSRGRLRAAIDAAERAIALDPDFAAAHWNQGTAALLAGDYGLGFEKYEWRRVHPLFRADFRRLPGPAWDGAPLAGRRLLVVAEQGLGDTIQMARYLPLAAATGGAVTLVCDRRLTALLSRLTGVRVVARDEELPEHDVWADQMSLPRLFRSTPRTLPQAGGYLTADPRLVDKWHARLPPGRRIGLVWAGNPGHSNDRRRSLPFTLLSPLLEQFDHRWIILQLGPARTAATGDKRVFDAGPLLHDFDQTAAAVRCLDLVIAVDTSTTHLAGALGVPVWTMLPYAPDWRWLLDRPDDTPWYHSLRLFRQPGPGDWATVVARVAAALAALSTPQSALG